MRSDNQDSSVQRMPEHTPNYKPNCKRSFARHRLKGQESVSGTFKFVGQTFVKRVQIATQNGSSRTSNSRNPKAPSPFTKESIGTQRKIRTRTPNFQSKTLTIPTRKSNFERRNTPFGERSSKFDESSPWKWTKNFYFHTKSLKRKWKIKEKIERFGKNYVDYFPNKIKIFKKSWKLT